MNSILLLIICYYVGLTNTEMYTTKYDDIDVDEILHSDRLLKNYLNCLMERGPCTPDATELKRYLPEALETDCSKCTEKQTENAKKILKYLYNEKPDYYRQLQGKYDPENAYYSRHEELFA